MFGWLRTKNKSFNPGLLSHATLLNPRHAKSVYACGSESPTAPLKSGTAREAKGPPSQSTRFGSVLQGALPPFAVITAKKRGAFNERLLWPQESWSLRTTKTHG